MKDKALRWLNTALMFNLFFVMAGAGWFAAAVVGRSLDFDLGLDLFYKLWQPVFNPAIGLLILGSLVSGISGWVSRKFGNPNASS